MKITIQTNEKEITIYTDGAFNVLVDDEILLEHAGEKDLFTERLPEGYHTVPALYACPKPSSLFSETPTVKKAEPEHISFDVPSSSFIESIRWWEFDEGIGHYALEINLKDQTYLSYSGVPKSVILNWILHIKNGYSAGKYFNENIKRNFKRENEGEVY